MDISLRFGDNPLELNRKSSVDDFESFCDHPYNKGSKIELINGRFVLMAGNMSENHQRIARRIMAKAENYLEGKPCEVFYDFRLHLYREEFGLCENLYEPDIMINCDTNRLKKNKIVGVPEFIAEVISKSTRDYDYDEKRINYLKYGVKELWLVDLFDNKITVHANGEISRYTFYDEVHSVVFPDFKIAFREILNAVDKDELKWYV